MPEAAKLSRTGVCTLCAAVELFGYSEWRSDRPCGASTRRMQHRERMWIPLPRRGVPEQRAVPSNHIVGQDKQERGRSRDGHRCCEGDHCHDRACTHGRGQPSPGGSAQTEAAAGDGLCNRGGLSRGREHILKRALGERRLVCVHDGLGPPDSRGHGMGPRRGGGASAAGARLVGWRDSGGAARERERCFTALGWRVRWGPGREHRGEGAGESGHCRRLSRALAADAH